MILHACHLSQQHGRLIVRCDDIDVLVLLVHYHSGGHLSDEVYIYAGHSGKERYVPVVGQYIALPRNLDHWFVEVSLLPMR